jgi:endogenous inhibitor of DNA gyrase (YacG/DUF329 family)
MQHIMSGTLTVTCPTCSAVVEWTPQQRWRPFCSERCHMIDLGNWLDESNRIPDNDSIPGATPQDQ